MIVSAGAMVDVWRSDRGGPIEMRPSLSTERLAIQARTFAECADGRRIPAAHWHITTALWRSGVDALVKGWAGPPLPADPEEEWRVLSEYRIQPHDIEDAVNQFLGRDPELTSPPRLSWDPLQRALQAEGIDIGEDRLLALPFSFEFAPELLDELDATDRPN